MLPRERVVVESESWVHFWRVARYRFSAFMRASGHWVLEGCKLLMIKRESWRL